MEQARRIEDKGLGRLAYHYPLIAGAVLSLLAVGGYIATLKNVDMRVSTVEARTDKTEVMALGNAKLVERVIALQETSNQRITRLENMQDKEFLDRGRHDH